MYGNEFVLLVNLYEADRSLDRCLVMSRAYRNRIIIRVITDKRFTAGKGRCCLAVIKLVIWQSNASYTVFGKKLLLCQGMFAA